MVVPAFSHDTLFAGKLFCAQPRDGYRFSIDAVLLAHFVTPRPRDRVLDLGAGCGVVALILAFRYSLLSLTCLEIQPALAELISHNIAQNGLSERMALITGDLCRINQLLPAGTFDLVVSNPPYYRLGSGRHNADDEQAMARHEVKAELRDFAHAAAFALRTKGRLAMIYPAARGAALFTALRQEQLEPKRLQAVYPYPGADATLLLVEAVKGGGEELVVLPPLYIHERPGGDYSQTVAAYFAAW